MLAKTSLEELTLLLGSVGIDNGAAPPPVEIEPEEPEPERPEIWAIHSRVRDDAGALVSAVLVPTPRFRVTGIRMVLDGDKWKLKSVVVGKARGRPLNIQREAVAAEQEANNQSKKG